jgi:hypothetical protein
MESLPQLLEFAMLFAFGFSWPFAIARTYRSKRVDGKSPAFMFIVIFGYCCGIAAHVVEGTKLWLCWVYLADIALVSTDLSLYFHYSRLNRKGRTPCQTTQT